jgi:hypothetical protein
MSAYNLYFGIYPSLEGTDGWRGKDIVFGVDAGALHMTIIETTINCFQ